jgi:hypothetical protein
MAEGCDQLSIDNQQVDLKSTFAIQNLPHRL